MSNITKRLSEMQHLTPAGVTLVAVSKTKPNEDVLQAYEAGQRHFGENKVQELTRKAEELPSDIHWHMIGHLQRNKVKYIAPFVHLIHGVDSLRLLKEIEKQGSKIERKMDCLLQIHIAKEESKFGLDESELYELLRDPSFEEMRYAQVVGMMGMATHTSNEKTIRNEFAYLNSLYRKVKQDHLPKLNTLSMGMSNDYALAIEEGSTMIRVGSHIFGARD